jgi:hypothetical protein
VRNLRAAVEWLRRDSWLGAISVGLSLALFACLFGFRDLPVVDLPQHAAQIATWQRWDAGVPEVVQRFELNFRTPYLLAYPIARVLAPLLGPVLALKFVIWLAITGNLVAVEALARRLGHEPWLGLFGLVTATGLCFYFGFISFMLAMPLVVAALAVAVKHAETPSLGRALWISLLTCLALSAHGIAFVMGFGTVALVLLRGGGAWPARLVPLVPAVVLAVGWFAPGPVSVRIGGDVWDLRLARLPDLPALLVSMGASDHLGLALGIAVLAVTAFGAGWRPVSSPQRWLPLVLLLTAYGLFPSMFRGIVLLHTRLPCFLLPLWILAAAPPALSARARGFARGAMLGVTAVWLAVLGARLVTFNREAAEYHELAATLPPGKAVRPIIFQRDTRVFPGVPAYLHYSAYYYVEKGGSQGYSFAMYPLSVVRFRPEIKASMQGGAEWLPELFQREETAEYDYFLVRDQRDRRLELFGDEAVELAAHVGSWWAYARRPEPLVLQTRGQ